MGDHTTLPMTERDVDQLKLRLVMIESALVQIKEDLGVVSTNTSRNQLEFVLADLRAAVSGR